MSALYTRALLGAARHALAPAGVRMVAALAAPERAQQRRLRAIVALVTGTRQAAAIAGWDRVRTLRELQDAVPIRRPDEYASLIEDAKAGTPAVLTTAPIVRFEKSGGSSGPAKYVPYTRALLAEFHRALLPWLADLLAQRPALRRGPSYWSISPLGAARERTSGGIPVGSADDAAYFPRAVQPLLAQVLAVPSALAGLPDVETCRYVTLRLLLARPSLALVSVWNPSFLSLLLAAFDAAADRLLADLRAGTCRPPMDALDAAARARAERVMAELPLRPEPARADALATLLREHPQPTARGLWPGLALVSAWTDAQAARLLPALSARLGGIEVQGKGLLATEGVTSFPLFGAPAPVLAVDGHVLEFLDPQRPEARPRLAHELEVGQSYEVVLSTSGGLLRYRIGDLVRVDGFLGATPCVRFVGRADRVSDLVGEKLNAIWVGQLLDRITRGAAFAMLAPEWTSPPAYHLLLEADVPDATAAGWAAALEAALASSHHYGYARALGQLGAVRAARVHDGARRYERRCIAAGQRPGDVKPPELARESGWLAALEGRVITPGEGARASAV